MLLNRKLFIGNKVGLFAILLIFFQISIQAQSSYSIQGFVVSQQEEPMFGNAMILTNDSTLIKGMGFFDGYFSFADIKAQKILLKLSSLSFEDTIIHISFEDKLALDLGEIKVQTTEQLLEALDIISEAPLIQERTDGSLVVKVKNTALSTSISVNEILSRSPNIIFNSDGEIEVFGKGAAVIFLNGIKISTERLSTLSPTEIESIEIISNPGPRYDAEGNAVINIITKRNMDEGAKGMLKNYLSYSDFAGLENRSNFDYSFSKGKWILNGNYGLTVGNYRQILRTTRVRNIEGDFFSSDLVTEWPYDYENFSNYLLGIQYNFTPQSYLSFQYTGAYEQLGGQQLSKNTIINDNVEQYFSQLAMDELTRKNTYNLNYFNKLDSIGSSLFLGVQLANYQTDFDNLIDESIQIEETQANSQQQNSGKNDIEILSAQADYTKPLSSHFMAEFGAKVSAVNVDANTAFFDLQDGEVPQRNETLSNSFTYEEKIVASYLNFKGKINTSTNYSFGLRAELTDYQLKTSLATALPIEDHYLNFFTNASIKRKITEESNMYLSYTSRIRRVPYSVLNPFVIYQDAFTSIQGNTDILPARFHALELGGNYKEWRLKLAYTYAIDPMYGGAFQSEDNPKRYILQRYNMSEEHIYLASLSRNINMSWWQSTNTASISWNHLLDSREAFEIDNNRQPYFYLYSQNSFPLSQNFKIYLTAWYRSNKRDGIYFRKDQSSVNLGLESKLFNNSTTVNLDFNDIFHKVRAAGEYTLGDTDILFARQFNTNYIRVSFSYNFGKLRKSNFKNKDVGKSEKDRS